MLRAGDGTEPPYALLSPTYWDDGEPTFLTRGCSKWDDNTPLSFELCDIVRLVIVCACVWGRLGRLVRPKQNAFGQSLNPNTQAVWINVPACYMPPLHDPFFIKIYHFLFYSLSLFFLE